MVSDGSSPAGALGWSTVTVDCWDPSATNSSGVSCDVNHSLAAEWLVKVEAAHLDFALKIPRDAWYWATLQIMECRVGPDGPNPTPPLLDRSSLPPPFPFPPHLFYPRVDHHTSVALAPHDLALVVRVLCFYPPPPC